jgi:hypothetical protein
MGVNDSEALRSLTRIRTRVVDACIAQSLEQVRLSLELLKYKVPNTWGWADYRAYVIGADGHIAGRIDLKCADEAAAKLKAKLLADHGAIELWQGLRRVARFEPTHETFIASTLEVT